MRLIKNLFGKILYAITYVFSAVLYILISIMDFTVKLVTTIAHGFRLIIGMGGCLIFFMFSGPLATYIIFNPYILLIVLFFVIFPLLGTKFISLLKYVKFTLIEYLFDRAKYLMYGTNSQHDSFSEYGNTYRKAEEAKRRKEQQDRQSQQQKEWDERFKQWQEYQNFQGTFGNFGGNGYYNGSNGQTYSNPTVEFKKKYKESCDLLGISDSSDKYQIKLAYRQKAKEYHPDMNKSANATDMFQKINGAYEFLSDSNIERYKNMQ